MERMSATGVATVSWVTELESAVSGHSNAISPLEAEVLAVKREVSTLKERCEDMEAMSSHRSFRERCEPLHCPKSWE